jgi:serine phosphatase RsbU (regulator of sigma subunit)
MAADDALVLFTDGISEAVGEEGEEYGVDRLAALLSRLDATGSGRRLAAACLADVAAFRAAGAATTAVDDVALLVVRRTGG